MGWIDYEGGYATYEAEGQGEGAVRPETRVVRIDGAWVEQDGTDFAWEAFTYDGLPERGEGVAKTFEEAKRAVEDYIGPHQTTMFGKKKATGQKLYHEIVAKITLAFDADERGVNDSRYEAIQSFLEAKMPEPLVHHVEVISGLVDEDGVRMSTKKTSALQEVVISAMSLDQAAQLAEAFYGDDYEVKEIAPVSGTDGMWKLRLLSLENPSRSPDPGMLPLMLSPMASRMAAQDERCAWTDCPYGGVITVGQRFSRDERNGLVLHLECRKALWHLQRAKEEGSAEATKRTAVTWHPARPGDDWEWEAYVEDYFFAIGMENDKYVLTASWGRGPDVWHKDLGGYFTLEEAKYAAERAFTEVLRWGSKKQAISAEYDYYELVVHRRPDEAAFVEAGGTLAECQQAWRRILSEAPPAPQAGSVIWAWIKSLGPHSQGGYYEKLAGANPRVAAVEPERVKVVSGVNGTYLFLEVSGLPGGGLAENLAGWDGSSDVVLLDRWGFNYVVPGSLVRQRAEEAGIKLAGANPYSPEGNPYVPAPVTPGIPDDMLDGPHDPYPRTLDMPMTTDSDEAPLEDRGSVARRKK